jgi:hypothetical protein
MACYVLSCQGVFLHKGTPKTANRKITLFEAHTQQKCPFTAYLQGFVNAQSARHLKTGFLFSFKMSLISFPMKDGKPKKKGAKVPGKK